MGVLEFSENCYFFVFFIGIHSMQTEQALRGMELQENKAQKKITG